MLDPVGRSDLVSNNRSCSGDMSQRLAVLASGKYDFPPSCGGYLTVEPSGTPPGLRTTYETFGLGQALIFSLKFLAPFLCGIGQVRGTAALRRFCGVGVGKEPSAGINRLERAVERAEEPTCMAYVPVCGGEGRGASWWLHRDCHRTIPRSPSTVPIGR